MRVDWLSVFFAQAIQWIIDGVFLLLQAVLKAVGEFSVGLPGGCVPAPFGTSSGILVGWREQQA